MNNYLRFVVSAAIAICALGANIVRAEVIDEHDLGTTFDKAQFLNNTTKEIVVPAVLGTLSMYNAQPDLDFYSFYAQEGDVMSIDIDDGWGGKKQVDIYLTLWGPGDKSLNDPLWWKNDLDSNQKPDQDAPGSSRDPRLDAFKINKTGVYTIGISNYARTFVLTEAPGTIRNGNNVKNGDYTLIISGVTPPVKIIGIDIKPGSELSPINPKSRGKTPVALLSDATFDAMADVNTATLTFGSSGDEASLAFCHKEGTDFNQDGRKDMLCHFQTNIAGFTEDSTDGVVKGRMKNGQAFQGRGFLKVVPH